MMDARRVHAGYERFVSGFLRPLLAGGTVRIGRPVAPATLEHFATARPLDPAQEDALGEAFRWECGRVAPVGGGVWPGRDAWALAMAAHDLIASTDPTLQRLGARRALPVVLGWVDALLAEVGRPRTRESVLGRHTVANAVQGLVRRDVAVRHWAGVHRFDGRPVPGRVRALPRLRRVRQTSVTRSLREACRAADDDGLGRERRLDALLDRSPLTPLLSLAPHAFGAAALDALGDPAIRQGVAFHLAARGMDAVAEPLDRAVAALGQRDAPPEAVARAAALARDTRWLAGGRTPERPPPSEESAP